MLGPDLLVAPVFEKEGKVSVYAPITGAKDVKWRSWYDHAKTYDEER